MNGSEMDTRNRTKYTVRTTEIQILSATSIPRTYIQNTESA